MKLLGGPHGSNPTVRPVVCPEAIMVISGRTVGWSRHCHLHWVDFRNLGAFAVGIRTIIVVSYLFYSTYDSSQGWFT